jgi:hypothetical protein
MVSVFSFCIYGPEIPKYYHGLLENIQLINRHYPGWLIYVYAGDDVPAHFLATLRSNPSVVVHETGVHGQLNTLHRFFAIDDPVVEVVLMRDADSRVHWKDRWAINDFLSTRHGAHIVRDHEQHGAYILAGLWGIRKGVLPFSVRAAFEAWTPVHLGSGDPKDPTSFGMDQNFLTHVLYPVIRSTALIHYSNGRLFDREVGKKFPFVWTDTLYCGKVEVPGTPDLPQPDAYRRIPALNFLPWK